MKPLLFLGKIILVSALVSGYNTVSAQCNPDKTPVENRAESESVPHSVPFDGGATALIVAGTVYAIKRLYSKPKQSK